MRTDRKTYEFVIQEIRYYNIVGDGRTKLEAEQDAVEAFHRLRKSQEIAPSDVSRPKVIKARLRK